MNFLIKQIDRLINALQSWTRDDPDFSDKFNLASGEALQLLQDYAPNTQFLKQAQVTSMYGGYEEESKAIVIGLRGFHSYLTNGLGSAVSLERRAQIEVVNDFIELAEDLLDDKNIHPVASIVIVGAALEEFLRNWCVDIKLVNDTSKGSIDKYTMALRAKELITKQDVKEIGSWGGLRNEAAHGHWENASNRDAVRIMLMGVNLFMRKYSPENREE